MLKKKKKKRQRIVLSYEQSFIKRAWLWSLTGICYSTHSEHSLFCFTDYTKLYVCEQSSLTTCLEAGPALVVPWVSREWTYPRSGAACRRSWLNRGSRQSRRHILHCPGSRGTENPFVLVKRAFIPSLWDWARGWEEGNVCPASSSAAEWLQYLLLPQSPPPKGGEHRVRIESALRLGEMYCN